MDIDFTIVGPNGQTIESGERVSNGKYAFKADMDGVYTYCFSNKMSTMTPKIVMFTMDVGEPTPELSQDAASTNNLLNHSSDQKL